MSASTDKITQTFDDFKVLMVSTSVSLASSSASSASMPLDPCARSSYSHQQAHHYASKPPCTLLAEPQAPFENQHTTQAQVSHLMRSRLNNTAILHDHNHIGRSDGAQTMGNDNACYTLLLRPTVLLKRLLNGPLRSCVQCCRDQRSVQQRTTTCRRLVQQQDPRSANQRPTDADSHSAIIKSGQ